MRDAQFGVTSFKKVNFFTMALLLLKNRNYKIMALSAMFLDIAPKLHFKINFKLAFQTKPINALFRTPIKGWFKAVKYQICQIFTFQ